MRFPPLPILNNAQPLNRASPFNDGVMALWRVAPQNKPNGVGGIWRDMNRDANGRNDATFGAAIATYPALGPPLYSGSYGSIRFASSAYAGGTTTVASGTNNFTLSAWIIPASLPQAGMVMSIGDGGGSANGYGWIVGANNGGSGSSLFLLCPGIAWIDMGYTFATANIPYHVRLSRIAGTWKAYVNGVQTANTDTTTPGAPTSGFGIGCRYYSGIMQGNLFDGWLDHVRVQAAVVDTYLAGEDAFNWIRPRYYSPATAAASSGLLLRRRRLVA